MQKDFRLTGSTQHSLVYSLGRSWSNRLLVLKMLPNEFDRSRYALLVGRRIGNAVVRNYIKRRLREVVRLVSVKSGWDVMFIARRGSYKVDFWYLKKMAEQLLRRSGLLIETSNTVEEDR